MSASEPDQHAIVSELATKYRLPDYVTPLGAPAVPYYCAAHPDVTLGRFFARAQAQKPGQDASGTGQSTSGSGQSTTGTTDTTPELPGSAEAEKLFAGLPQSGRTLGRTDAPLVLYEFIDYQCPFCAQFSRTVFPSVVNRYVRTGKLQIRLMPLAFIGPDSETAASAASAAGAQDRQFNFTDVWFANQKSENSGYVTDGFIDDVFSSSGVDQDAANQYRQSAAAGAPTKAAQAMAARYDVVSTPTFVAGRSGGSLTKLDVDTSSPADLSAKLDRLLGTSG